MSALVKTTEKKETDEEIPFKDLFIPLTNKRTLFILIIVGFLVFFNSLFTPFVWDDTLTVLQNPEVHQVNIANSFSHNNLNNSGQYRPFSMLYFSVMYFLFSDTTFFWHIANLSIHIANAFFLYLLLKKFIDNKISL